MTYVTDTNLTPAIQSVAWFCLAAIIFCWGMRALTKALAIQCINLDDYFITLSVIFAAGETVSVLLQTTNGFGKPISDALSNHVDSALKASYAANLAYILSVALSKSAVLAFVRTISPVPDHRRLIAIYQCVLIAVAMTAVCTVAFQCSLPKPWDYINGRCIQWYPWWMTFEAIDAITDLGLIILPAYVIRNVAVSINRKVSVVLVFAIRLFPIAGELCKMVYLTRRHNTQDPFLNLWPITICTQAIQCLSIVSACLLYLRPFLRLLESGFFNLDDLKRKGVMSPFTLADRGVASSMRVISGPAHPLSDYSRVEARSNGEAEVNPEPYIYRGRTRDRRDNTTPMSEGNGTRRWKVER